MLSLNEQVPKGESLGTEAETAGWSMEYWRGEAPTFLVFLQCIAHMKKAPNDKKTRKIASLLACSLH